MKNLFESDTVSEVLSRINKLQPATQRQWGKMDAAQMLAHCSAAMEMATGESNIPRVFIGRLIGGLVKPTFINEKPFSKNSPTAKELIFSDPCDFSREQEKLRGKVRQFHEGGEAKCTRHPHPLIGPHTPHEWSPRL